MAPARRARTSRRSPKAAPAPPRRPAPRTGPTVRPPHVALPSEEPHAHAVCRICGRIQGIDLTELDRHVLEELARRAPEGWSAERIAFSVAGACQRCRQGPSAP